MINFKNKLTFKFIFCAFCLCVFYNGNSQVIKRKFFNAVVFTNLSDSALKANKLASGILVNNVLPVGTGAAVGLKNGDILISINKQPITKSTDLRTGKIGSLKEGDEVIYEVFRKNQILNLKGNAKARPEETRVGIEYAYESVPYKNGFLHSIVSKPAKNANTTALPAILFIQGYTCGEMVDLDTLHPYRQLTDGLTKAGYIVMRVEKPGVGNCLNTKACSEINFNEEVEAFEAALQHLKKAIPMVDTSKIHIWGHSLGGIISPVITAKNPWIKGAIVYGTLNKIWGEYIVDMTRIQNEGFGLSPVEVENNVRAVRKIVYEIYTQKKSPIQFATENPELVPILKEQFMWQPASNLIFTRSSEFNQTLDDVNPNEHWSKTKAKVLAIYGEADIEALNADGAQNIVKTVNHYHPGNASFLFLKGTDHSFARVGTIEDGYKTKADPNYYNIMIRNFNPELVKVCIDWLKKIE
ncbi:MAG: serine aminopeptidase domain-containing protein [Chitinophagaceae bacterium]